MKSLLSTDHLAFIKEIKQLLNNEVEDVFLYWKGRVALYALLKAIGIKEGDEVILPAYTCVVVPNAIIYLGAKPVYVDVSTETYNIEPDKLIAAITKKTKAIICQNTYGLSTDLEVIKQIGKEKGIYTIEDCTHGFGGVYKGKPNGLVCDASFFSTQWNKPFSTGVGGFAITKNKELRNKLKKLNYELNHPKAKELLNLKILFFIRRYFIHSATYWPLVKIYRWLAYNSNKVVGSSSVIEIQTTSMPENYYKSFSEVQAKEGVKNLHHLDKVIATRKKIAHIYTNYLKNNNKNHVEEKWFTNHSFLKYPLLVKNRKEFMTLARKNKIEIGEWFVSPLHPIETDLTPWEFDENKFPNALFLSNHVINLPTTPFNLEHVLDFLEKNKKYIFDKQ